MGRHEAIEVVRQHPFVWPAIELAKPITGAGEAKFEFRYSRDDTASIVLSGPKPDDLKGDTVVLELEHGLERVQIIISAAFVAQSLDLQMDAWRALAPSAKRIYAEHVMSPVFRELETQSGLAIAILALSDDCPSRQLVAEHFCFDVQMDGVEGEFSILLRANPEAAARIIAGLEEHRVVPITHSLPADMSFEVALVSPDVAMDEGELGSLQVGDAVVFDEEWSDIPATVLKIGGVLSAALSDRQGRLALRSPLVRFPLPAKKEQNMPKSDMLEGVDLQANPELSSMTVKLSVELDRSELTLGAISELRPGAVVPFERTFSTDVRLLANGIPFAEGELVQLGENVGVRLTQRL